MRRRAGALARVFIVMAAAGAGLVPTATIRTLATPFIVFTSRVVVYDKVLGLGTTDALDPNLWGVFLAVIYAYFGGRTI
ncbi:MAG TPA: hypothetical protein VGG01_24755 [Xanthobacteraceae bacterium]|jgi:hypothetical protein